MPGASAYSSDTASDLWKANDKAGLDEHTIRAAQITANWKYYDGKHKAHLKSDYTQTDDNVVVNKVGQLVDQAVTGLLGSDDNGLPQGVQFEVIDQPGEGIGKRFRNVMRRAAGQENPVQAYLDDLWELNGGPRLQYGLAMNGSVAGHCFMRIVPSGLFAWWKGGDPITRLINLDPALVTVFWDVADVERVLWYRLDYGTDEIQLREDIVRGMDENGDDLGNWQIWKYRREKRAKEWTLMGNAEPWARSWSPIVDWPNIPRPNAFYGLSDIGLAGKLNDSLNFALSNTQRIYKYHGQPLGLAFGVTIEDMQKAIKADTNDILAFPNGDGRIDWRTPLENLDAGLQLIDTLNRAIFDVGREMDAGAVQDKLGQLTNFGLRVLFANVLAKIGTKRMVYGDQGFLPVNRRLLDLGNQDPATPIMNNWPDPLPVNQVEEAQALDIDRRHGASQYSYLTRRNYDPDLEAERRDLEQGAERAAMTSGFLNAIERRGFGTQNGGRTQ